MGQLVLVPTPIGNLGDITLRAIETLKAADLLYAEDTRVSQKLLQHLGISKKLYSFHQANEHKMVDRVAEEVGKHTLTALLSDAGTPAISDPGFLLVRKCIALGHDVTCLPGATAFVPALAASGLPSDAFYFEGFLPRKKGRKTKVEELLALPKTVVVYESPYRMVKLLQELLDAGAGEREIVVAREISKKFEEFVRGTAEEVKQHFDTHSPKGEFVVLIKGFSPS